MKTILKVIVAFALASVLTAQNDDVLRQKKLEAAADELKARLVTTKQTFEFVSGQLVSGPPVKGAAFEGHWHDQSPEALGSLIIKRMPPASPGSLGSRTYTDVEAYLLRENGGQAL